MNINTLKRKILDDETLWSGPESNGDVSAAKLIYPIQHEVQMRTTRYQAPYLDNLVLCLMGLKSSLEPILETSQLHVVSGISFSGGNMYQSRAWPRRYFFGTV
jgi:hypothetical protein